MLGVAAPHHDAAACLLRDGRLMGAAEEERFTRRKHQDGLPVRAVRWLLDRQGATPADLEVVAVGEDPEARAARRARWDLAQDRAELTEDRVRQALGVTCAIRMVPHHEAHGASAYHFSGLDEAAVLVVDGVGEVPTTTIGRADPDGITTLQQVDFPHSLGLLYATITAWLGMRVNHDEYKVMGLGAYGSPRQQDLMERLCPAQPNGGFRLDLSWFDFARGAQMYSDALIEALGPARRHGEPLEDRHADVAASVQVVLEERLLALARRARELTGLRHLCAAGGVLLNAVANGRIVRKSGFADVFIQPVAGDAGTALGAAAVAATERGSPPPRRRLDNLRLGPSWSGHDIQRMLTTSALSWHRPSEEALWEEVCALLATGRVVGWFEGPMELGPRALGGRSILADPRSDEARRWINTAVKEREAFRPLAPIISADAAADVLDTARALPFMNETVGVRIDTIPAVTHVDGSARPQTVGAATEPRLTGLLDRWVTTSGVPVLINTSFNHASEPIVCSPQEALRSAVAMQLDAVVLEDIIVSPLPADLSAHAFAWGQTDQPVTANLYPL